MQEQNDQRDSHEVKTDSLQKRKDWEVSEISVPTERDGPGCGQEHDLRHREHQRNVQAGHRIERTLHYAGEPLQESIFGADEYNVTNRKRAGR